MRYRLEITEKKNGENLYTPQVGIELVRGLFIAKKITTTWKNIVIGYPSMPTYEESTTMSESWGTEQEALAVIEGHKEKIRIKNGEVPSNVTYKEIE
jgi:hypothetical protein